VDTQQFGQVTWLLCGESVESDEKEKVMERRDGGEGRGADGKYIP